jgi:hypothetical protein
MKGFLICLDRLNAQRVRLNTEKILLLDQVQRDEILMFFKLIRRRLSNSLLRMGKRVYQIMAMFDLIFSRLDVKINNGRVLRPYWTSSGNTTSQTAIAARK